ncbi:M23 family metallopeptidase [Sphingomonas sp. BIUV-7]|uniref:M23 family metallopeptidase n=1 Tax=Sphingomonas natans TaxID=3063330 RepID=A0ABT8Y7X2_9SPHN|nr:M23 family metallopeptidase [Sphingomonas sp. BIUV-7]MDO6413834.1 M23 family metallopeptidase [Sphingomonas sp. BIUV-7]
MTASRSKTVRSIVRLFAAFGLLTAAAPAFADTVMTPQVGDKIVADGAALDSIEDAAAISGGDDAFHAMFMGWKKQDQIGQGVIAVPSAKPINAATFTSGYGVRSDPFRGSAAMHAGIDLAAPQGTAVYATADGIVDKAEWSNGYGNLVEVAHGKGVQTRFGHLSRILVHSGQLVHRGDLIALVGSTGRSTGPHLHYEVRIDGHAVNPVPFLQAGDYVVAQQQRATTIALGGPDDVE